MVGWLIAPFNMIIYMYLYKKVAYSNFYLSHYMIIYNSYIIPRYMIDISLNFCMTLKTNCYRCCREC